MIWMESCSEEKEMPLQVKVIHTLMICLVNRRRFILLFSLTSRNSSIPYQIFIVIGQYFYTIFDKTSKKTVPLKFLRLFLIQPYIRLGGRVQKKYGWFFPKKTTNCIIYGRTKRC